MSELPGEVWPEVQAAACGRPRLSGVLPPAVCDSSQHTQREHRPTADVTDNVSKSERGATKSAELSSQHDVVERMLERLFCSFLRDHTAGGASGRGGDDDEWLADGCCDLQVHRLLTDDRIGRKGLAEPHGQLRIVGLPDSLAGGDSREVDCMRTEGEFYLTVCHRNRLRPAVGKHLVDPPTCCVIAGCTAVEGHAITAFDATGKSLCEFHYHTGAADSHHAAEMNAPLRTARSGHQSLVVNAGQPAG